MRQLSVIIPVYNAETFLRECLDSVFAQRDVDLEVISVGEFAEMKTSQILKNS